jgi:diadenosine tetraphosphatase ApaH/serine/threonine PP2A family protein phosphatase
MLQGCMRGYGPADPRGGVGSVGWLRQGGAGAARRSGRHHRRATLICALQQLNEFTSLLTALLSDIHGNLEALHACLGHARARGAGSFVFLGDFVGYGADARGVVDVVAQYAADGAVVLKGNHDEAVDGGSNYFNEAARAAIEWARETLTEEQKRFLAALPLVVRQGETCYVHASAEAPERWNYVDSPSAARRCADAAQLAYTFCGHVHDQTLYVEGARRRMKEFRPVAGTPIPVQGHRRWVTIVGSVGQPRDRNPAAAYALFDLTRRAITFCRVAYDAAAAADKIRNAGLPASLAIRVELGI